MPLLAIDVGNTRLKWAIYDGRAMRSHANLLTADATDAQTLAREWQSLQITEAIVSNVAGATIAEAIKNVMAKKSIEPQFISSLSSQCGVTNNYANPHQLGTDRWAALIGAHQLGAGTAKVVVMAGTALTIDALSVDGKFLGGIILPGPGLMRQALHLRTAQLPPPLPNEIGQFEMFPTNTLNAIASGAIDACVGAIARMRARLSELGERNASEPTVIASGGALSLLAPHATFPLTIHENLVLEGLMHIAHESHQR